MDDTARRAVLESLGAVGSTVDALAAYCANPFPREAIPRPLVLPLPDEPHVEAWRGYEREARSSGAWAVLRDRLPQLRFPVAEGMSGDEGYRAATLRGEDPALMATATGLDIRDPDGIELRLHVAPAGTIPLVIARDRHDFTRLVQALTRRNRADPLPDSMGAAMVGGYNNWDRIRRLRDAFLTDCPGEDWAAHFQTLLPRKELYQDRFIILSRGPYSGVPAAAFGLTAQEWNESSIAIRAEHECTHYFTRRLFGGMHNNALDEILCDYMGLVSAYGRFEALPFLWFVGLEGFPRYRPGGRLQNYLGHPPLDDDGFRVLQRLVHAAAIALEEFDAGLPDTARNDRGRAVTLLTLSGETLESLAADGAPARLLEQRSRVEATARLAPHPPVSAAAATDQRESPRACSGFEEAS